VLHALANLRNWAMRASRQRFESEQLFMGRYSVAGTADWGAYTVMTGTDAKTNREICLKVTSDYARHAAEAHARRRLSSEFVVEFFDSLEDTLGNYTTVLEYGTISLRELLTTQDVSDSQRRHLAERLLEITRHLHACGLVHADLRPDHFFLIGHVWKLADLSRALSRDEPLPTTRGAQPLAYCAPEFAALALAHAAQRGKDAGIEVAAHESLDTWGLALCWYELFSGGLPLYPHANERTPLGASHPPHLEALADRTAVPCLGNVRPPTAQHLLTKMLAFEPSERPSLDLVSRHAWFTGGLDTSELEESFSGMQHAQELTQRQLGSLSAWLRSNQPA